MDVLDTLLELEIAYSMLKNTSETGENHIDSYYMKLNAEIQLLDKISSEYKTLELFIKNTHAETHRNYELEIIEVSNYKDFNVFSSICNLHLNIFDFGYC